MRYTIARMPSFDRINPDDPASHQLNAARQGIEVDAAQPEALRRAIELAFDYRGDVTITRRGMTEPVTGYLFDRRVGPSTEQSYIRLIPTGGDERLRVPYAEIERLSFTGRDTAAGKSFETWMKKFVRNKLAGREANIHGEPLVESD